ncbi:MAG: 1-acyl-sn-glycerol-3-phosphate acyltransferase [Acidobacteria bacterium]|nr:1-acyl-sn-glycerol-3-phosphate acyltransferase [Acidobacteriota bacterium]
MTSTIEIPVWLAVVAGLLALWAALGRLLVPSVRWLIRRRIERALEEVNPSLQIRLQPFKFTQRKTLIDRLVYDRDVMETADRLAGEWEMPRDVVQAKVARYAKEIVPSFNAWAYFRWGYSIARWIARTLYRVRLGSIDEAALRSIPANASVVFVMNHRSNMDYILVSYLAMERTALSYAVGEWARIWPLEQLIRSMGAYFVRRKSRNPLYRKVLSRYVHLATREGVTQAIYPEGGLSRDGSLGAPRLGLLDYMLRGFDPDDDADVVFVPVGINYDRVLEDRTLLLETDPEAVGKKGLAAVWATIAFWSRQVWLRLRGDWYRFGYACVNFGGPLSASDFFHSRNEDPRRLGREERFASVGVLAEDLMGRVAEIIPVLPVSLVATVLLADPERTWSQLELEVAVQRQLELREAAGEPVYVPRKDRAYAVEVGIRMLALRHVLDLRDGLYRVRQEDLGLLAYYANAISGKTGDRILIGRTPSRVRA